jgi:hypothetical protein
VADKRPSFDRGTRAVRFSIGGYQPSVSGRPFRSEKSYPGGVDIIGQTMCPLLRAASTRVAIRHPRQFDGGRIQGLALGFGRRVHLWQV